MPARLMGSTKTVLPFILLILLVLPLLAYDFSISASSSSCNTLASYTISTYLTQTIAVAAGSTLMVSLPQEYNTAVLRTYSYSISGSVCLGPCGSATVSFSGNSLLLGGLFPFDLNVGDTWDVTYTVTSLLNPNAQNPSSFTITIFKGSTIYYSGTGSPYIFSPTFTLQTVSFTTQLLYPTIWAVSPLKFTITPNFAIDTIKITFPAKWALFPESVNGAVVGGSSCSSASNPTANCSYSSPAFTLSNLYYFSAGTAIDVTVSSINNPSSAIPAGPITLELYANSALVQKSSSFSLAGSSFTNDVLRKTSSSLVYQAGDKLQVLLNFQFSELNQNTDKIYLTFPPELTLPTTAASYAITMATVLVSSPAFTFFSANNTVAFNISSGSTGQIAVNMTISGLARPRECKNITSFTIKTYRSNLYLMDSTTCCSLQLANRQTLTINSIGLSTNLQGRVATYTFTFSTSIVTLITTDSIQIVFPPEYSTYITAANSASLCSTLTLTGTNFPGSIKAPTCSIGLNTLVLSSFLTGALAGIEKFVVVMAGVTNPSSTPTTGFSISTLSTNSYVLEQALNYPITIQASTLASFSVNALPLQTYATAVYTFSLGNNSPLANGYSILITFPADITTADFNAMQCKINAVIFPCSRKNSTFGTSTIIVLVAINAPVAAITSLTISAITNPISMAPTASFSATILDASGATAQLSSGSFPITMASTNSFTLFSISAVNASAGATLRESSVEIFSSNSNSVWVTVVLPFAPPNNAAMLLVFATSSKLVKSGSSACSSTQVTSPCLITNNAGNGNLEVSFASMTFATASRLIQVEITKLFIADYVGLQATATLSVNAAASLATTAPAKVANLYAEAISAYSLSLSSQILGQATTATISITVSAQTATQLATIQVYIPEEFGAASYTSSVGSSSFIGGQLSISGLTNPTVQTYTPFLFTIINANGDTIAFSTPTDSSKTYGFTLGCPLPCRTCASPIQCIDCYTTISWIPQIYFRSSAKTCVTQCVEGEYLSAGSCLVCSGTCLTCLIYGSSFTDGDGANCLTCPPSKLLSGTTCMAACPSGSYASTSLVCQSCMPNCLTCVAENTCATCQTGYSLSGSQCLTACPASFVSYINPVTLQAVCVGCPANCLSCSSLAVPQCLSCATGYYLNAGGCVSDCSSVSLFISYGGSCAACQCKSCSVFTYACMSCNAPKNLLLGQCLSTCPSGYYPASNVCQLCAPNCLSCTSTANCQYCQIPYALTVFSVTVATCSLTCPIGTINTIDASLNYVCKACSGNCLTCQTSPSYCLTCSPAFILNNHTCVTNCPTGYWKISGACLLCSPACQTCQPTDPYNCSACTSGYYYANWACSSTCPVGSYADVSSLTCLGCNIVCGSCLNATNCTSCATGYYLHSAYCYANCAAISILFYSYSGSCLACQPQCLTCLATPFQCSTCVSTAYFFNPLDSSCGLNCTLPYFINGNLCSPCQPPCSSCDTLFDSCLSCLGNLSVLHGQCLSACPSGYYNTNQVCMQCPASCLTCNASLCFACQTYAFRFQSTCVADCQATALPITVDTYCTSCAEVPYCQACQVGPSSGFVCFFCVYPYVIFQGTCLNTCPDLYAPDDSNTCVPTPQYAAYLSQLETDNYPYLPPFSFLVILILAALLAYATNKYPYAYHAAYLISLTAAVQLLFLIYGCRYLLDLYQGEYTHQDKMMPLLILGSSVGLKVILAIGFVAGVVGCYYLKDVRFQEWKEAHPNGFRCSVVLGCLLGCRFYKLYYSKWGGKTLFGYRIVSVEKFYYEDLLVWVSALADLGDLAAFGVASYNVFPTYAVLYLLPFELLLLKVAQWALLAYDMKKPDRGFFLGDEEEAARAMQEEQDAKDRQRRQIEIESLVKLIRSRSAENLKLQRLYEHVFVDDFRSVFDPRDYEDTPVVPLRKLEKNINRGAFRKGKRITMEEKLRRFAESIKPAPVIAKDNNGYLKGLIYWKPPKQLQVQRKKEPESQESMMKLLEDKELYYEGISSVQIIDLDDTHNDNSLRRPTRTRTPLDEETVINDTYDRIYDPSSIEFVEEEQDMNGLWNKNYARKKHLPQPKAENYFDDNDLRVFHHQPLKKRRSRLNEIRARHY